MPLVIAAVVAAAAGGVAGWLTNDRLERAGIKAPGQTAPGTSVHAIGAGIAIGVMLTGAAVLYLRSVK